MNDEKRRRQSPFLQSSFQTIQRLGGDVKTGCSFSELNFKIDI
jgi:hypothetical protein